MDRCISKEGGNQDRQKMDGKAEASDTQKCGKDVTRGGEGEKKKTKECIKFYYELLEDSFSKWEIPGKWALRVNHMP